MTYAKCARYYRLNAFTLIECLITVSLIAIVVSFIAPFSRQFVTHIKAQRDVTELNYLLNNLRLSAITRGESLVLCPLGKKGQCGDDWSRGLYAYRQNETHSPIGNLPKLARGAQLTWTGFHSNKAIVFKPNPFAKNRAGHFDYQLKPYHAMLIVNRLARTRVRWI